MGERFGQYGIKSGVDIRCLWPSIEEIEDITSLRMHRKAKEAAELAKNNQMFEELRRENRLKKIEENWKKHDAMLEEYYEEKAQSMDQKKMEGEELQRKVRQVQEYFGYWVDPEDPRFEFMLAQRDDEVKLQEKLAKQKAKKGKKRLKLTAQDENEEKSEETS
uniref:Large ribosomal subunit protein mL64 n=1 Tax=Meloidogyne incognita TaxID=6306 RepID=A0A914KMZ5_MELIC